MLGIIRKNFIIVSLLLSLSATLPAYAKSFEKQSVQAVLTLNLARFATWPEQIFNKESPTLSVCVVGDSIVKMAFAKIDKKRINNKTVHVINLSRLRHLSQCHVIYISEMERKVLKQVLLELKNMPILTVGENMQFIKSGGMIGLETIKGKIQININLPVVKQSGLIVSSRILKLAIIHHYPFSTD